MSAEIRISIEDDSPSGSAGAGKGGSPPPDLAARWSRTFTSVGSSATRFATGLNRAAGAVNAAVGRFAAGLNQSLARTNAALGSFANRLNAAAPAGGGGGGGSGGERTPAQVLRRNRAKRRLQRIRAGRQAAAKAAAQQAMAAKQAQKQAAMQAKRNAQRGAQLAKASLKAAAQAQQQAARARAKAAAQAAARRQQVATAAGGAAAAVIRGGGPGAALGGAAGSVIGGRFGGPAGAAIGGAIGEKAGAFADNPLKGAGDMAVQVARGDAVGALTGAADKAAMGLALIPGAGIPAAMALKAFTSTVGTAQEVLGAFAARGRELSPYSGQIAAAGARQDVTRMIADIREARQLEGGYAKVIDKLTETEEIFKAILLPIKDVMLKNIPDAIDFMMDGLTKLIELGYLIPGVDDDAVTKLTDDVAEIRKRFAAAGGGKFEVEDWIKPAAFGFAPEPAPAPAAPLAIPIVPAP